MDDEELLAACQQKMATDALRPGQGDIVRHLQRNDPCLAIMPTGGGKSLLWLLTTHIHNLQFRPVSGQKPLTLVVVPYKALVMSHLHESAPWFLCLSSENDMCDISSEIHDCSVIYSTPEKIVKNMAFQQMLIQMATRIRIIAIDEVHLLLEQACFRPNLLACIDILHRNIPHAVRLAVTATSRIADSGRLLAAAQMPSDSHIVRCSLDRSNCFISIAPQLDKKDKHKLTKFTHDHVSIFQLINKPLKPQAIVFVCSKKEAENLALQLQSLCACSSSHLQASEIVYFHADLSIDAKQKLMKGFSQGSIRVVVATTAFGTGVNYGLQSARQITCYMLENSRNRLLKRQKLQACLLSLPPQHPMTIMRCASKSLKVICAY